MRPILIGLLGALFFSLVFILNRAMELAGGSWIWSASLRFYFMLPILILFVGRKQVAPVLHHLKRYPVQWFVWSTIGFGIFYASLTYATIYAPGWLVAGTFQLNIVIGSLLVPFINKTNRSIPVQSVLISLIIIFGVFMMQIEHANQVPLTSVVFTIIPLIVAAVSYPVANRKMMQVVDGELTTTQRILGMTIASLPFWIILSVYGVFTYGAPSQSQIWQTFIVALFAGVFATQLYFYATELVRHDNYKLAGVESTVTGAVVFSLIGELLFLNTPLPKLTSFIGIGLVVSGIIFHSVISTLIDRKRVVQMDEKATQ
ncbi:multidrug resistance efflux transporter family protein [Pseudogracilibacillus sp. SE30717A]|uniref:DMT family transporter n=1 Tax=Pseudogracilibacillus sp. SE30717A TaxID=3098293 RepID=UPI00300DE36B